MGTRGPAPKPTALKKLAGNPGKRALNPLEPKSPKRIKMPATLGDAARVEWRRLVRQLEAMNLLQSVDADALALYCETYVTWATGLEQLRKLGTIVKSPSGYPIQNPYFAIVTQCQKQMQQLLSQFGMTPASRTRIQVPEEKGADEFDDFLNRRSSG